MTSVLGCRDWPTSEEEFLALGETRQRVELSDGGLMITGPAAPRHQLVSGRLHQVLHRSAEATQQYVLTSVNVRLRPMRLAIPDLVVTTPVDLDQLVVDAAAVTLACEITAPSTASIDKILKTHDYAAAGIEWYLLVEQEAGALHRYRLAGETYREHSVTRPGEVLRLTEPVEAGIAPEGLLPPH